MRALGARSERHAVGDCELVVHRLGPAGGEPWILLHGLGSTGLSWAPALRALRRDCQLAVPELSTLGGSRIPGEGLTVSRAVALLPELLEQLFPGRAVTVAGTSLGGWMAVRLALAAPERVARLFLLCPGGYLDQDWMTIETLMSVRSPSDIPRLVTALFSDPPWWMRLARGAFHSVYTAPAVQRVLRETRPEEAFGDAELAAVRCPTALVWGEDDGIFRVEVGRRMAAALPEAELYVLPAAGHVAHWETPRAFREALHQARRRFPAPPPSAKEAPWPKSQTLRTS
jgi:pimeloyl-ACP methyl ester carboxylesterase